MEQKEFTDYIIPKLINSFPEFAKFCEAKPNNVIDIIYRSSKGKLTLWMTTQNKEITVGFTGLTECDWHTHMSLWGANTMEEELQVAIKLIGDIINDKSLIVHSNLEGYSCAETVDQIDYDLDKGEIIEILKWSDL
jgi:hypothetical protein